jgi:hypothetical protein
MITVLRWILSIVFGSVFLWIGSLHAAIFFKEFILRQRAPSYAPLVAGICGTLALLIVPLTGVRRWWWIPLVLDWGSLPGILFAAVYHLYSLGHSRYRER